jgi:hypothetical protein
VACPIGEGGNPLPNGGDIRARRGQLLHQPVPTQAHDQVEGNDVLEQADHVMAVGMQEVGQQAVGVAAGLAPNPLDRDAVVDVSGAGRALVGSPADQAAVGLAVGTGVRCGEAVTGEGNGFGVLLHRTGKVLYNDHELGTPPSSWSDCQISRHDGRCRPFWLGWVLSTNNAPPAGGAPLSSSLSLPSSPVVVTAPCYLLSCRSFNVTAHPEPITSSEDLSVLFGRDWPHFDQRKWPITPGYGGAGDR